MTVKIEANTFGAGLYDELTEVGATLLNQARGCRQATNMITLPQGAAKDRPPSRYIAATKAHGAVRMFRVVYSDLYAFLAECGDGYVRFYTNSGQIVSGAAAYEIASPYTAAQLWDLQAYNDAGTLYLTHPGHAPYALVYTGAISWALAAAALTWGPFRDLNDTPCTITPSGTTANITLTATGGTPFVTGAAGHVGAKWLIGHSVGQAVLSKTFTGNDTSSTIAVAKDAPWGVKTTGSWDGTLTVQRSYDGSIWEAVLTLESSKDVNYPDEAGVETIDDATYRLVMTNWATSTSCKATFTVQPHVQYGYATITAVTSSTLASATVVQTLAATTATALWAEGSWSPYRGYPRAVGMIDNRLTFLSNLAEPTTYWLSHTNQFLNFRTGAAPADALTFTMTIGRGDPLLWLLGGQYKFYIGTPSKILEVQTADPRSSISATNKPEIAREIEFGASSVPPVRVHATIVMMDPANLRPMRVEYEWQRDILMAPDMAFQCPTLTAPGIKKIVFQPGRVPLLWYLRTDGVLLGVTFEETPEGSIIAWHGPHETDGVIEDIECLPGGTKGHVLWWVVARTVGGVTHRHVEQLDELELQPVRATAHGLDAYTLWDGGAAQALTTLAVDAGTGRITVTVPSHGWSNGYAVRFAAVGGMTWLNAHVCHIADVTTHTFTLQTTAGAYLDGRLAGMGVWTTGGTVQRVAQTLTGLGYLQDKTLYAVADGEVLGPYANPAGTVALPRHYNYIHVGLFQEALLQPLRLVVPTPDGTTRGRQANVAGLWLSVQRSWECEVSTDGTTYQTLVFWDSATPPGSAPELVTDDFYRILNGTLTDDPTVVIRRSAPLPLCIRALMLNAGIHGLKSK